MTERTSPREELDGPGSANPRPKAGTWKFVGLVGVLAALVIVPFLLCGDVFDETFSLEGAQTWLSGFGPWAWIAGVGLLVADIIMPVPSTVVMSALGYLYGWWWGGWISALGAMAAGYFAYGLSRLVGRPGARWLAGEEGLAKGEKLFQAGGGWMVALSRWTPVLAEVIACLAGLARMPIVPFTTALACGAVPLGFIFAAIGHLGQDRPSMALALSAIAPVALWLLAHRFLTVRSTCRPNVGER